MVEPVFTHPQSNAVANVKNDKNSNTENKIIWDARVYECRLNFRDCRLLSAGNTGPENSTGGIRVSTCDPARFTRKSVYPFVTVDLPMDRRQSGDCNHCHIMHTIQQGKLP